MLISPQISEGYGIRVGERADFSDKIVCDLGWKQDSSFDIIFLTKMFEVCIGEYTKSEVELDTCFVLSKSTSSMDTDIRCCINGFTNSITPQTPTGCINRVGECTKTEVRLQHIYGLSDLTSSGDMAAHCCTNDFAALDLTPKGGRVWELCRRRCRF